MNKSGQRALEIFNNLDRKLKSADKKDKSDVGGQKSKDKRQWGGREKQKGVAPKFPTPLLLLMKSTKVLIAHELVWCL